MCPHRLGHTWSSRNRPAAPACLPEGSGAGRVERPAVAGVGVDDHQRARHGCADPPGHVEHLGLGEVADVRQAQLGGCDAVATDEDRLEPGVEGQLRRQRVPRPRHGERLAACQPSSQVLAGHGLEA
jgi:hypothetical protein